MTTSQAAKFTAFRSDEGRARYLAAYDAALEEWPVPYEELDVPTRYGTTHVVACGPKDAPPLVLLPSLAASATLWRPNVAALAERFRLYAIDPIGQPGKSLQTRKYGDRRGIADWLSDVLDALAVRRTSFVGASYGGFIAMNQASLTPERVDKVVLIGPAGVFVGVSWKVLYKMLVQGVWRKLAAPKRKRDITDLLGPHARLGRADQRWREQMNVTMSESSIPDTLWNLVLRDDELSRVKAPVLLLIGEREQLYSPVATLELAQRRLPGLTGAVIADAHHLAALAQPDDVNARILEFLRNATG
jgi:pimeloyl-ACP methyl ester carboxylesterase